MDASIFLDLLVILAAGFIAGTICKSLGISTLVGYLVVGAIIGKGGIGLLPEERDEVEFLARGGVLLLLFSVGLEFSLTELANLGKQFVIGGSVQMTLVAAPVIALAVATGVAWRPALLLGAAASFSSTVLVFKALSEWGQTGTAHGRRAIGILLFQDVALAPLLLLIPLLTGEGELTNPLAVLELALTSALLVAGVLAVRRALQRWIVPLLARLRSPELVVLFTLAVLGTVAFSVSLAGIPPALGAFAAGLAFNGNRMTEQVDALVLPFRESFSALFFVSLGLLFDAEILLREPALVLGGLVGLILLKSAAAAGALRLTGLSWVLSLAMGVGLSQMGEFAFVLVMQGWKAGLVTQADYDRTLALAIGSLILTPLLLKATLHWTAKAPAQEPGTRKALPPLPKGAELAVVIGVGPIGRQVASRLEISGLDVCLVDLSPVNLYAFAQQGFRTVAGDASTTPVLEQAMIGSAHLAVVCVPEDRVAVRIVKAIHTLRPECSILVRCRYLAVTEDLTRAGADEVVSEEAEASGALLRAIEHLRRSE